MLIIEDFLFQHFNRIGYDSEWKLIEALAKVNNDVLNKRTDDIIRTKRILEGSALPLGLLAIGIFCQILRHNDLTLLLVISGGVVFALAVLSTLITIRLGQSLERLEDLAVKINHSSSSK